MKAEKLWGKKTKPVWQTGEFSIAASEKPWTNLSRNPNYYEVRQGMVGLEVSNRRGDIFIAATYKPGDIFGFESGLTSQRDLVSTARILLDDTVVERRERDFSNKEENDRLLEALDKQAEQREWEQSFFQYASAQERTAYALLDMSVGDYVPFSQSILAARVGVTRETLNKALGRIIEKGFGSNKGYGYGVIFEIQDRAALKKLAR